MTDLASSVEPAIFTIFGITGDLAQRKLLPALYHLKKDNLLPRHFIINGITRRGTTKEDVLQKIRDRLKEAGTPCDESVIKQLGNALHVVKMDMTDVSDYHNLKQVLDKQEARTGTCLNRLFYLAIPSQIFAPVVAMLGEAAMHTGCQHHKAESRLLIEKPFGFDLESAHELINVVSKDFNETQIYRIDHYLAKETVQNILTFRMQNPLFNTAWDSKHISRIMITAAEKIGIEGRVAFYEQMGALRDLVQSHLLQLLAIVTMEAPTELSSDAIHAARLGVLQAIRPPAPDLMASLTVRGQYHNYKKEVANERSTTETFAAVQLSIDNETWQKVPVLIRTGKGMAQKATEITIVFEQPDNAGLQNYLTIRIQPNEGIVLQMRIKKPGYDHKIETVQMNFCYGTEISPEHPDAYERVIVDSMRGDKTLFATSEEVLECWRITQPILHAWEHNSNTMHTYKQGSWGPIEADELVANTGGEWLTDELHICSVHKPHAF